LVDLGKDEQTATGARLADHTDFHDCFFATAPAGMGRELKYEQRSRRPTTGHNRTVSISAQLAAKQPYRVDTREQRVDRTSGAAAET
jgi:hypothetical protein